MDPTVPEVPVLRLGLSLIVPLALIACENSDGCLPPNATILAEVKWGRTQDEDDDTRTFGAGIRYHL